MHAIHAIFSVSQKSSFLLYIKSVIPCELSQSGVVPYTSSSKVATGFTNCATLSYEVRYEKNQKQKTKADFKVNGPSAQNT